MVNPSMIASAQTSSNSRSFGGQTFRLVAENTAQHLGRAALPGLH